MAGERMDLEDLEKESEVEFFRAGGPGGQHRNKVETGVRVRHLPTGIEAVASERRSQARNRRLALERLRDKIEEASRTPRERVPTRPGKASRQRRLEEKSALSEKKRLRGRVVPDED